MSTAPNVVVARLTASALLGRRRLVVLLGIPVVLVAVAILFRLTADVDDAAAVAVLGGFGLGTLLPLLCVIVGTGAIGPEIEDGSIVYLLSKPLSRHAIVGSKLVVATLTAWALGAVPVLLSGFILVGGSGRLPLAFFVAAGVAALAYCALFLLLAVITRNAVIIGLMYALIWETTIAGFVPGARSLSIREWSTALAEPIAKAGVNSSVGLITSIVALIAVSVLAFLYAGARLRSLRLSSDD